MQVAISVVAAVMWMIEHPELGLCVPDDLPHEYILDIAKPYLGKFISTPSDWTPLAALPQRVRGYARPVARHGRSLAIQELPGRGPRLMVSRHTLQKLARKHGTPLFVVDHEVLRKNYESSRRDCRACRPTTR